MAVSNWDYWQLYWQLLSCCAILVSHKGEMTMSESVERLHTMIQRLEAMGAWGMAENLRKILRGMK